MKFNMSRKPEHQPKNFLGFYIAEDLLNFPDQLAIVKLTYPRLFVRFNYAESYFSTYEEWVEEHTDLQWLDPNDKPTRPEEIERILIDCWNFLGLHEREEERLADLMEDDEDFN
jgi:hypothetical protein